jgi:AcrR family transcriptional regulator
MSGKPNSDRRNARRQATQAEIVEAAWILVGESGLAGLSMRDLGERVGMRAQSVYSYFASKHEIYDAMFLGGYQEFAEWMDDAVDDDRLSTDPAGAAKDAAHAFVEFCTSDTARYQLLFQRTIPGFTPSSESYSVSLRAYQQMADQLAIVGVDDQATLDLWTAVLTGLASQQISNDPGGDRWKQLIDRAVEMLLTDIDTPVKTNATLTTSTDTDTDTDTESEQT